MVTKISRVSFHKKWASLLIFQTSEICKLKILKTDILWELKRYLQALRVTFKIWLIKWKRYLQALRVTFKSWLIKWKRYLQALRVTFKSWLIKWKEPRSQVCLFLQFTLTLNSVMRQKFFRLVWPMESLFETLWVCF